MSRFLRYVYGFFIGMLIAGKPDVAKDGTIGFKAYIWWHRKISSRFLPVHFLVLTAVIILFILAGQISFRYFHR